jgi:hypothetical protein
VLRYTNEREDLKLGFVEIVTVVFLTVSLLHLRLNHFFRRTVGESNRIDLQPEMRP